MGSFGNQLTNGKQTNTGKRDRTVRSPLRHKWLLGITFNPPTPLQRDRVDPIAKMQSSMHPIEAVFWASGIRFDVVKCVVGRKQHDLSGQPVAESRVAVRLLCDGVELFEGDGDLDACLFKRPGIMLLDERRTVACLALG